MPEFDPTADDSDVSDRIMKSAVTPRPIAWVSSLGTNGVANLAPFSSYNYVSSNHPAIIFNTPDEEHGGLKDTVQNAIDTREFAVNVVTEELGEQMDTTSANLEPDESEFEFAGVEQAPCVKIEAPRVANAVVTMECRLYDTLRWFDRVSVVGEVIYFHVDDRAMTDGKIDMETFKTVGRLGGPYYTASDRIELERQF